MTDIDNVSYINPKQTKRAWAERDYELETIELPFNHGKRLGIHRCAAIGLIRGDCQERRADGKLYCYYHQKAQDGLLEVSEGMYPVWPLPTVPWKFVAV